MSRDFVAMITDPARAEEWRAVLGVTSVCVQTPFPQRANLPDKPNHYIYLLDIETLSAAQRTALVHHLAQKFQIPVEEVAERLPIDGVPILAEDVTIAIHNPMKWMT